MSDEAAREVARDDAARAKVFRAVRAVVSEARRVEKEYPPYADVIHALRVALDIYDRGTNASRTVQPRRPSSDDWGDNNA